MKQLTIGRKVFIVNGLLAGFEGEVIGFDSEIDLASVQLDSLTIVGASSENLLQEGETIQLSLDLNEK